MKISRSSPNKAFPFLRQNAITIFMLSLALCAHAQTYTVLHNFSGSDGSSPEAALIRDSAGNLYGTTNGGGNQNCSDGCGTVFKLDTSNQLTTLYSFQGTFDGYEPYESLLRDSAGNLYGATTYAGTGSCAQTQACGTFYKLAANGKLSVIQDFNGPNGSTPPPGRPVSDGHGNAYGTTAYGGPSDQGMVYELSSTGRETVLYTFGNAPDGNAPMAGLVLDPAGRALYGATEFGGNCPYGSIFGVGCGTVYKLDSTGETQLYVFTGNQDGANPTENLVQDSAGNLYGTTEEGGDLTCSLSGVPAPAPVSAHRLSPPMEQGPPGCGVVYKLNPQTKQETVLYSFTGGSDGAFPVSGVILDSTGNIYGAASAGGGTNCNPPEGCGTIFKIDTTGKFTVLHAFSGSDGASPGWGSLLLDSAGNLYGTTGAGGAHNDGVVFKITP
jgi:uncharacterized repeat protein (TIGR03803 family)